MTPLLTIILILVISNLVIFRKKPGLLANYGYSLVVTGIGIYLTQWIFTSVILGLLLVINGSLTWYDNIDYLRRFGFKGLWWGLLGEQILPIPNSSQPDIGSLFRQKWNPQIILVSRVFPHSDGRFVIWGRPFGYNFFEAAVEITMTQISQGGGIDHQEEHRLITKFMREFGLTEERAAEATHTAIHRHRQS